MPSSPESLSSRKRKRSNSIHGASGGSSFSPAVDRAASSSPALGREHAQTVAYGAGAGTSYARRQSSPSVLEKSTGPTSPGLNLAGSASPRTVVARQLENLALRGSVSKPNFSSSKGTSKPTGAVAPPAMMRFVGTEEDYGEESDSSTKRQRKQNFPVAFGVGGMNPSRWSAAAQELHSARSSASSSPGLDQPLAKRATPPRGVTSPVPQTLMRKGPIMPRSTPSSSGKDLDTPSDYFDLSSLTWQDSEITGHLMLDSDDDGYGINGVGFKPTAAMANARSLRRKQQVMAWRSREEKEERQRRAEKRKRYAEQLERAALESGAAGKKNVRFAV